MRARVDMEIVVAHGEVSECLYWMGVIFDSVIVVQKIRRTFVCCSRADDETEYYADGRDITCLMTGHVEYLRSK